MQHYTEHSTMCQIYDKTFQTVALHQLKLHRRLLVTLHELRVTGP